MFNDVTLLEAIYTPGVQDIANGSVTLTLTANKDTEVMSDDMVITFVEEPEMIGDNEIIAFSTDPIDLVYEIENLGNFNGWTTSGTGSFANPFVLQTVYNPTEEDFDAVDIVLTAEYSGCGYKTYQFDVNVHFSHADVVTPEEAKLNIHPNPTNDVINVSIDNITSDVQVTIYNNIGQVVYSQKENAENGLNTTINLNELSTGAYILQIRSDENIWTKKIIKK